MEARRRPWDPNCSDSDCHCFSWEQRQSSKMSWVTASFLAYACSFQVLVGSDFPRAFVGPWGAARAIHREGRAATAVRASSALTLTGADGQARPGWLALPQGERKTCSSLLPADTWHPRNSAGCSAACKGFTITKNLNNVISYKSLLAEQNECVPVPHTQVPEGSQVLSVEPLRGHGCQTLPEHWQKRNGHTEIAYQLRGSVQGGLQAQPAAGPQPGLPRSSLAIQLPAEISKWELKGIDISATRCKEKCHTTAETKPKEEQFKDQTQNSLKPCQKSSLTTEQVRTAAVANAAANTPSTLEGRDSSFSPAHHRHRSLLTRQKSPSNTKSLTSPGQERQLTSPPQ